MQSYTQYQRDSETGYAVDHQGVLLDNFPVIPDTDLFFTGYGWVKVEKILYYEWSVTFGQWGAVVIFPAGTNIEHLRMYTWPKNS